MIEPQLTVESVSINSLKGAEYNPRKWSKENTNQLKESIRRFGLVDAILVNSNKSRKNIVIGGHFRLKVAKDLGYKKVPVIFLDIPDIEREKELNLRLNRNLGEFDYTLLAEFDEKLLDLAGFTSEEMDEIFDVDIDNPEEFDIEKELAKLDIKNIEVKKDSIWQLGDHRLICGDSTDPEVFRKLMDGAKANMTLTDPPYDLARYKAGRRDGGKPTKGFGLKRNRTYLETDGLPSNFTELWMQNVKEHADPNFSIIVYEMWSNLRNIWGEMEKHWSVRNMIVWHIPNRHQAFNPHAKFFNKYDIAMVGASGDVKYNFSDELAPLQEEYEAALFAVQGKPHWEQHRKGKKFIPTDFIDHIADDAKQSGQSIIFGTKPLEVLIPYMKVLTKRGDIVLEPFGGAGGCLISAEKLKRKCYLIEKVPTYAQIIIKRWENLTGQKAKRLS